MEIRARYVQMGAFTLAVLVAGFAFVYWLNNAGGLRDRASLLACVSRARSRDCQGDRPSSSMVFAVGEVTVGLSDAADPRQVHATIAVDRSTPVRLDTTVDD